MLFLMWVSFALPTLTVANDNAISAQQKPTRKQLLIIGEEKGYRHVAVSRAMATIERLGRETGLWDTFIRTDTEALFSSSRVGRPSIVILDTTNQPSQGVRLHLNRQFRNFEAGVGYTVATGVGLDEQIAAGRVQDQLVSRRFHVVSARFKANS